jgi:hypothetical protein
MAQYTVQAPDGQTITLEGPDGASQAEVIAQAQKLYQPKSSVEVMPAPDQFGETGGGAAVGRPRGMDRTNVLPQPRPLESALAGATKSFIDPFVGGAQLLTRGNLGTSELAEKLGKEADVYAQENPVWYGSGRVAGALAPATLGSKTIGVLPSMERFAMEFPKLAPYARAATIGGVGGALTPEETGKKDNELLKAELANTALGSVFGAATPLMGKAGDVVARAGKSLVEPFYKMGQNEILGRALRQLAGNDAETAIANMRKAKPLVAGSQPTLAEAAQIPSLAAAQRAALNASEIAMNALTNRKKAQNIARIEAIENIKPPKEAIAELREKATEDLYNRANAQKVIATDEIKDLLSRPSMEKAIERAKKLAKEKGEDLEFTKEIPAMASSILDATGKPLGNIPATEGSLLGKAAHYIKRGLDDLTNYPQEHGISGSELSAIKDTKKQFLNAIETQLPTYKAARETYAELSKPISQADIIEEIGKSANFRGNLTPASLARALQDKTAQKVTGQVGATLENTLSPNQMNVLQNIKQDLLNSDFAETAGRGVGSDTMQKLAYSNMLNQLNLPTLLRRHGLSATLGNIAARASDVAYGGANKQLTNQMAEAFLDPKKAAALMKLAAKSSKNPVTPEQADLARILFAQGGVNAINALKGNSNE